MREELTAAVVWLVDQLFERALEGLQVEVKVDDLVDADRLRHGHRFLDGLNRGVLDLFHGASAMASTAVKVTWQCGHVPWGGNRSSPLLRTCTSPPFRLSPPTRHIENPVRTTIES